MLVLTRRLGESIIIGDNIKIKVVGIKRSQVKLAIDAPKGIPVHREEIYNRIKSENIEAAELNLKIFEEVE